MSISQNAALLSPPGSLVPCNSKFDLFLSSRLSSATPGARALPLQRGNGLSSLKARQRLFDARRFAGFDIRAAKLMELRQNLIGLSQHLDSCRVIRNSLPRQRPKRKVIGHDIEIGACTAATQAQCRRSCIDDLGDHGARWATQGWWYKTLHLLDRFGNREALPGICKKNYGCRRNRCRGQR